MLPDVGRQVGDGSFREGVVERGNSLRYIGLAPSVEVRRQHRQQGAQWLVAKGCLKGLEDLALVDKLGDDGHDCGDEPVGGRRLEGRVRLELLEDCRKGNQGA